MTEERKNFVTASGDESAALLEAHKDRCEELRDWLDDLSLIMGRRDNALYEAVDAYEREPELKARIEQLTLQLEQAKAGSPAPASQATFTRRDVEKFLDFMKSRIEQSARGEASMEDVLAAMARYAREHFGINPAT